LQKYEKYCVEEWSHCCLVKQKDRRGIVFKNGVTVA
jgi:hypothetical protein